MKRFLFLASLGMSIVFFKPMNAYSQVMADGTEVTLPKVLFSETQFSTDDGSTWQDISSSTLTIAGETYNLVLNEPGKVELSSVSLSSPIVLDLPSDGTKEYLFYDERIENVSSIHILPGTNLVIDSNIPSLGSDAFFMTTGEFINEGTIVGGSSDFSKITLTSDEDMSLKNIDVKGGELYINTTSTGNWTGSDINFDGKIIDASSAGTWTGKDITLVADDYVMVNAGLGWNGENVNITSNNGEISANADYGDWVGKNVTMTGNEVIANTTFGDWYGENITATSTSAFGGVSMSAVSWSTRGNWEGSDITVISQGMVKLNVAYNGGSWKGKNIDIEANAVEAYVNANTYNENDTWTGENIKIVANQVGIYSNSSWYGVDLDITTGRLDANVSMDGHWYGKNIIVNATGYVGMYAYTMYNTGDKNWVGENINITAGEGVDIHAGGNWYGKDVTVKATDTINASFDGYYIPSLAVNWQGENINLTSENSVKANSSNFEGSTWLGKDITIIAEKNVEANSFDWQGESVNITSNLGNVNVIAQGAWLGKDVNIVANNSIDTSSFNDDWVGNGVSLTAGTDLYTISYFGNWVNLGNLSLNANVAYIGVNDATKSAINKGIIHVIDDTKLNLYDQDSILNNYNKVIFDTAATFTNNNGNTDFDDFSNIVNHLNLFENTNIDYNDYVSADYENEADYSTNAARYNFVNNNGVEEFYDLEIAKVLIENPAGDYEFEGNNYDVEATTTKDTTISLSKIPLLQDSKIAVKIGEEFEYTLEGAGTIGASLYTDDGLLGSVNENIIINKEGSGHITLNGDNSFYNGVFNLNEGNITINGNNAAIFGGDVSLASSTSIFLGGKQSQSVNSLTLANGSALHLSYLAGHRNFTINDLVSDNGTIYMNTEVGDESSLTDLITVTNSISGTTKLNIIDKLGNGMEHDDGVKIIDMGSNVSGVLDDSFSLDGDQVDTGAYVYELYRGKIDGSDENSFYLRTDKRLTDVAKTIANEPIALLSITKAGMNSLQKRMGELRENNPDNKNGLWVRAYGKDLKVRDKITSKMNIFGTEAGYDHRWDIGDYKAYAGVTIGITRADNVKTKQTNGSKDGDGSGNAPNVGVYGTLLHRSGWFIDGVIRNFWEDLDLTSYSAGGIPVKFNTDRMITAYSVEVGKQYKYCLDCNSMFIFEPKVELMYAHADAKNFNSNLGNHIRYGNTDSFSTKAALMLGYKKKLESGKIIEPFVQLGIIEEWAGKTNVIYDGVKYKSDIGGTSYEFGGGFNMQITNDTSLYSDVMYETGDNVQSLSGNLGVRYTW